jgi:hypothetical protein
MEGLTSKLIVIEAADPLPQRGRQKCTACSWREPYIASGVRIHGMFLKGLLGTEGEPVSSGGACKVSQAYKARIT